ncbi:hypothetical protein QRB38_19965 [Mycobacterium avium subsp. hominissuis]|uniref:hypothetical protein n=1 Tax=Mycobacterium avium TaxID=1764 RepID=UPI002665E795|nr:hypothetical protein [Mycobacterium avium]MDO2396053.1 hypothetical protein [Mycobacterium avium subsp. hominissuis]
MPDSANVTVITTAPVSSGDPRIYTDPYPDAKGNDLVKETCGKCGGDGMYHAPSGYVIQNPYGRPGDGIKGCFDCRGRGHRYVKVSSVRSRIRRSVKATLQRDADDATRAAAAARHHAAELAEAWEQAHAEQKRRAGLNNTPAGQPGQRLRGLTGTVELAKSIEVTGFRGYGTDYKRLVIVTLDTGQVLKTFSTSAALTQVQRGDRVTVAGTVKDYDTYQGQTQTVLTRVTLHIAASRQSYDDINPGDQIQTGGDWFPVTHVDNDIHVQVTLGERSWTSRIRRDQITGHRPA